MDRKRRRIINFIVTIIVIAICSAIILISFVIKRSLEEKFASSTAPEPSFPSEEKPSEEPQPPTLPDIDEVGRVKFIDLQPTVDSWLATLNRDTKAGLMIYDINNSRVAASYQAGQTFNVASLYKLLFAYDGYRQIALGVDDGDKLYTHTSDKGDLTLYQCLDLTIRESYNGCADKLASERLRVGRVNAMLQSLEMTKTSNIGLVSTAADLTKLLRHYWRHTELTTDLWNRLADSMLNQPPTQIDQNTIYNWRQGLPAGFSDQVKVYNKVGWEWNGSSWNIYADAAIVDFSEFQHYYTIVVITQNLDNYTRISQLGQMIEDRVTAESVSIAK